MASLFNKNSTSGKLFNKISNGANSLFKKISKNPQGFANNLINKVGKYSGVIEKVNKYATPLLTMAAPEFTPGIMATSALIEKGTQRAKNIADKGREMYNEHYNKKPDEDMLGIHNEGVADLGLASMGI